MRNALIATTLLGLTACTHVPVGTIEGANYAVHVTPDAARICNEAWDQTKIPKPWAVKSCAMFRQSDEWRGMDLAIGEMFLPARLECVAYALPYTLLVAHETARCEGWHDHQ